MQNTEHDGNERERQLDAIIGEYYRSAEKGEAPGQATFIARYPDFQHELTEFFADIGIFQHSGCSENEDPGLEPTKIDSSFQQKSLAAGVVVKYFGVYEILEELGSGGMGIVYKARHARLRKLVALKMIRAGELASDYEVKMFQAEARAAAKLDHPGIVPVHEVGKYAGQHFYSMDYVAGGSLSKLHRDEPVAARRAAELVIQMAEATHYAHGKGIVHRDLKPANVLLTSTGIPRITDFGLAKRIWADEDSVAERVTETGQVLGTAGYMSPEQAEGKTKLVGEPADIYSLGAVLYALLTSRAPFVGESQADTIRQVIEKEPVSPRVLNPSLPRDLETICLKCLHKERHERYGTAQLLAEDLSAYLDGRPIAARPIGYIGRTAKWIRRHRLVSSLLLLTCVSMLTGTAFSVHFGISADQRAKEADEAKTEAIESLAEVELSDYLNRIALAQIEWQADNLQGCEELLNACPVHLRGWEWNYLKRLCHSGPIMSVDLAKEKSEYKGLNGLRGLSYSADGSRILIKLAVSLNAWDAETGQHLQSLASPNGTFAYDPSQNVILTDNRLIDGTTFQETLILPSIDPSSEIAAAFSSDGTLLAVGTSPIRIVSTDNGTVLYEFPVTDGFRVRSLAISPSKEYLAVGGSDVLQVWNLTTKTVAFSEPLGGQFVAFDASGNWLISGSGVGYDTNPVASPDIRIWSILGFRLARSFTTDSRGNGNGFARRLTGIGREFITIDAGVHHLSVCSQTQQLGVLSWDNSIRLLNLGLVIDWQKHPRNSSEPRADSRREVVTLRGDLRDQSILLAFDPAGKRLATVEKKGMLRVWDVSHPQEALEYGTDQLKSDFTNLLIGDSSTVIVSGAGPGFQTRAIDTINGAAFNYPEAIQDSDDVVLSEDGRILAALIEGRLHVRSVYEQRDVMVVDDFNPVRCAFSLDSGGRRLALWSKGHLRVWDVASGKQLCDITPESHGITVDETATWSVTFDPAGDRIAAYSKWSARAGVVVWHSGSAELIARISVPNCRKVFLSEDRLIAVSNDQLTCWSLTDEKQPSSVLLEGNSFKASWVFQSPHEFPNNGSVDRILSISGDFSRIVVRKDDETIIVLDASTGKLIGEPIRMVDEMAFLRCEISPDGSRLLGYKSDRQLHLHHIDGQRDILNLSVLGQSVLSKMTSDGNKIVSVSVDGIVRVLDGTPWEE